MIIRGREISLLKLKIEEKGYCKHWFLLWNFFLSVVYEMFQNPKFIFSFLVIMLISSAGIWAPWAFSIDLSPVCNTVVLPDAKFTTPNSVELTASSIKDSLRISCSYLASSSQEIKLFQNFSIFMFNLGLLGSIAAEFFIQKRKDISGAEDDGRVKEYAGFFIWVITFTLSFYALKNPTGDTFQVIIAGYLSILLWVFTNIRKKEYIFQTDPELVLGGKSVIDTELRGEGLPTEAKSVVGQEINLDGEGLHE